MLGYYNALSSEVYDLDKKIGTSFGDVEYYSERLSTCQGDILEPGVGTGRILLPLLNQGLNVEGFDLSEEMLEICQKNCRQKGHRPHLFKAKMEAFTCEKQYEAIIIPTGTFLLLHDRGAARQALKNFFRHLAVNGKIIIDIFLQTDLSLGDRPTKSWITEDNDVITLARQYVEVNHIKQYSISHNRYEKWRQGQLIQSELEQFSLAWYGIEEFKMLLKDVGFKDITISANYQHGQYPTNSDQTITFEATVDKD